MKADIDEHGCLRVTPETPLERYTLYMWWAGWDRDAGTQTSTLMIDVGRARGFIVPTTQELLDDASRSRLGAAYCRCGAGSNSGEPCVYYFSAGVRLRCRRCGSGADPTPSIETAVAAWNEVQASSPP